MRTWLGVSVGVLALVTASAAAANDLTLIMRDGRVTIVADNVPVRQILAEWARVGHTKIVGAERLTGTPLTLRFDDMPERQVLETLLRAASGFMAAPRAVPMADASLYDRILILPTSTAPESSGPAPVAGRAPAAALAPRRPIPAVEPSQSAEQGPVGGDDLPDDFDDNLRKGLDPADVDPSFVPQETNFDYANPQLMLQRRQQQVGTTGTAGTATPGVIQPGAQAPNVFPGTANPQTAAPVAPVSARPGEVIQPPQQPTNPYGIPGGVQPGSVQAPAAQPDRSKYMNPYQPAEENPPE